MQRQKKQSSLITTYPLHVAILSGGAGARLWPMSSKDMTKPFLKLPHAQTLLEQTVHRAELLVPRSNVWVVTTGNLTPRTLKTLPHFSKDQIIEEPVGKNTAAACMLLAKEVESRVGHPVTLLVLPADHYIPEDHLFSNTMQKAAERASMGESLITFGIKIQSPKTDYGYIELKKQKTKSYYYPVKRFIEKPPLAKAKQYAQKNKDFFWNSGMFMWRSDVFLEQMKSCSPKLFQSFAQGQSNEKIYEHVEAISIDYALMEKSKMVEVIPTSFKWSDLGTWAAVYESLALNKNDNCLEPHVKVVEGSGNLVRTSGKPWVLFGIDDLVIVESDDVVMVTTRQKSHDLKNFISKL